MLAQYLPPGSATWQALGGPAAWTTEAHLLAAVIDVGQAANWQRQGDKKAPRPKPIPRPTVVAEEEDRKARMLARARAFRERQESDDDRG